MKEGLFDGNFFEIRNVIRVSAIRGEESDVIAVVDQCLNEAIGFLKPGKLASLRPFIDKVKHIHQLIMAKTKLNYKILIKFHFHIKQNQKKIIKMLIDKEHYLQLINQNDIYRQDALLLTRQNQLLAQELEKQKCVNYQLMHRLDVLGQEMESRSRQVLEQNQVVHQDLKGEMRKIDQKQRKYLNEQIQMLENSSFSKYKLLQVRNTANRIDNHQLSNFHQKIKKIFQKSMKNAQEPSFKQLVKWIKTNCIKEKEKQKENMTENSRKLNSSKADITQSTTWKFSQAK